MFSGTQAGPACIAPAITDADLSRYAELANVQPPEIKDSMLSLLNCVKKWWELPESTGDKVQHFSKKAHFQKLDETHASALWDHIPYEDELVLFDSRFERMENGEARNAAYHLLWHVRELNLDREPITMDKI